MKVSWPGPGDAEVHHSGKDILGWLLARSSTPLTLQAFLDSEQAQLRSDDVGEFGPGGTPRPRSSRGQLRDDTPQRARNDSTSSTSLKSSATLGGTPCDGPRQVESLAPLSGSFPRLLGGS